jgi:hypothetical protein
MTTGSCSGGLEDQFTSFGVAQAEVASADLKLDKTANPGVPDHANLGTGQQTHFHQATAECAFTPDFDDPGTGPDRKLTEIGHAGISPSILIIVFNCTEQASGPPLSLCEVETNLPGSGFRLFPILPRDV